MAIIKTVTNGDRSATFKAVSLGHVVAIVFGLVSLLGAQQTWLLSGIHERRVLTAQIQTDIDRTQRIQEQSMSLQFGEVRRRLEDVERRLEIAQRQININTGRIERMR